MKTAADLKPEEWVALWSTYPDGWGAVIDWSGVTAIGICQMCDHVTGVCFSIEDAKAEIARHRQTTHVGANWSDDTECRAPACTNKRHSRGLCTTHMNVARVAFLDAVGPWCDAWECDRGATARGLCSRHWNSKYKWGKDVYNPPPAPKPKPEPEPKPERVYINTGRDCKADGCDRAAATRGLCRLHYIRQLRTGKYTRPASQPFTPPTTFADPARTNLQAAGVTCHVEGCDQPVLARLMCGKHYRRAYNAKRRGEADV